MLLCPFLLSVVNLAAPPVAGTLSDGSLLTTVPDDAWVLVQCRDVAALRERAERNDWYRLLGSAHGRPMFEDLAEGLAREVHTEAEPLLAMARSLEGEAIFFDTGKVAGFVTEPPSSRAELAALAREWLPRGEAAGRRTLELESGSVELVAWPDEIDGWSGRAGHYAAFVDHPRALGIYSGDDEEAVFAAVTRGVAGLVVSDRMPRAPLVTSYLEAGGGQSGGIELFVDFTPLAGEIDEVLEDTLEHILPDPTDLLGLEQGTWLHASADVFPGTRIECQARLHLPQDTLVAELADTFSPLPTTLPAELPQGVWALWALNWDIGEFYGRARAAYEEANGPEGLQTIDGGIAAAKSLSEVDVIVDVVDQLEGDFALYFVDPPEEKPSRTDVEALLSLGIHAGLVDGPAFMAAFEKAITVGGLDRIFDQVELAGVDAWVIEMEDDDGVDGGIAFLPQAFAAAPARRVLERSLKALTLVEGASLLDGSAMQATIDESSGACFLSCMEMTPMRRWLLPDLGDDLQLPPLEEGQPAREPFDSRIITTVTRTKDGFEAKLETR